MVPELRKAFNESFTKEKYEAFLADINSKYPGQLDFRIAETPIFIPKDFTEKIMTACERIVDVLVHPAFEEMTRNAVPDKLNVPAQNEHSHFIAFDFGICINEKGEYEPKLIEMQGFPTLLAYQAYFPEVARRHFTIPENSDNYLNGFTAETYIQLLNELIVGKNDPKEVILLELFPQQQKTRIDFASTEDYLGVKAVCLTELISDGKKLYYYNGKKKTRIKRIYNRLIFDELQQQSEEIQEKGKVLFEELDVEWVPHPNWFYRISKYTLPHIHHPYVPVTYYLDQILKMPTDLENYVLKPLFSFAGQGVIIDVTDNDIKNVKDPSNWILQRKVKYADVIETPDENAKAEIRIFYFWKEGASRPIATNNLARLSKGKMVGVRYNKDKEWVGGTFCLFEK